MYILYVHKNAFPSLRNIAIIISLHSYNDDFIKNRDYNAFFLSAIRVALKRSFDAVKCFKQRCLNQRHIYMYIHTRTLSMIFYCERVIFSLNPRIYIYFILDLIFLLRAMRVSRTGIHLTRAYSTLYESRERSTVLENSHFFFYTD